MLKEQRKDKYGIKIKSPIVQSSRKYKGVMMGKINGRSLVSFMIIPAHSVLSDPATDKKKIDISSMTLLTQHNIHSKHEEFQITSIFFSIK